MVRVVVGGGYICGRSEGKEEDWLPKLCQSPSNSANALALQFSSPQFGQLFLNAKNVDLSDIQIDSLSKFFLK